MKSKNRVATAIILSKSTVILVVVLLCVGCLLFVPCNLIIKMSRFGENILYSTDLNGSLDASVLSNSFYKPQPTSAKKSVGMGRPSIASKENIGWNQNNR